MNKFVSSTFVKRGIAVLFLLLLVTGFAMAQGKDEFGISGPIAVVLGLFTSPVVKGIAAIFLILLAIGLVTTGRQEPEMFKKFIPWIAGVVIFMAAGTIVAKFFESSNTSVQTLIDQLNSTTP
jgi:type IV secretory pathway VirB2 component (pilin)